MNWVITEIHNLPLILCGFFYSVLCIFSLITGLMYASGKRKLNPIELSDSFVKKLNDKKRLKEFAIKMGYVTFVVGIFQGISAFAIFKGYNEFLNIFAILFTIFSICSVLFKLKGKINAFPIIKLVCYLLILFILLLFGTHNYEANKVNLKYLKSSKSVNVVKINEGYFFDGVSKDKAIIFFPGGRVEYKSYAKLMYKLAENGYDTFLLSVPLNLAFFAINKPENIIKNYNYEKWYLAGHSLGGVAACEYASKNPNNIVGIINLASYPSKELPSNIEYISFYGREDRVLNMKKFEESKELLPENNQIILIDGANHSGYANYGKQNGDGKSLISSDEQQDYVINKLLEMGV